MATKWKSHSHEKTPEEELNALIEANRLFLNDCMRWERFPTSPETKEDKRRLHFTPEPAFSSCGSPAGACAE